MLEGVDVRRRWRGMLCLTVAAGLLVWGQTVLEPVLQGVSYVLYWLVCFGLTLAAILIALLDIRATRRRVRREHQHLLQRVLEELEEQKRKGGGGRS